MSTTGLSSGTEFLVASAKAYFDATYQNPVIHLGTVVDASLNWVPAMQLKINDHLTVIAEASETPYPLIFSLRRVDVLRLQQPIAIYCVCPEEVYLKSQREAKRLMADG